MDPALDGIITFFASHHAMRAEQVLQRHTIPVRLVPGPRELSPSCGVALRFPYPRTPEVESLLAGAGVEVEQVVHYPPERAMPGRWARLWGERP